MAEHWRAGKRGKERREMWDSREKEKVIKRRERRREVSVRHSLQIPVWMPGRYYVVAQLV